MLRKGERAAEFKGERAPMFFWGCISYPPSARRRPKKILGENGPKKGSRILYIVHFLAPKITFWQKKVS